MRARPTQTVLKFNEGHVSAHGVSTAEIEYPHTWVTDERPINPLGWKPISYWNSALDIDLTLTEIKLAHNIGHNIFQAKPKHQDLSEEICGKLGEMTVSKWTGFPIDRDLRIRGDLGDLRTKTGDIISVKSTLGAGPDKNLLIPKWELEVARYFILVWIGDIRNGPFAIRGWIRVDEVEEYKRRYRGRHNVESYLIDSGALHSTSSFMNEMDKIEEEARRRQVKTVSFSGLIMTAGSSGL
jgi:hypothetical protein